MNCLEVAEAVFEVEEVSVEEDFEAEEEASVEEVVFRVVLDRVVLILHDLLVELVHPGHELIKAAHIDAITIDLITEEDEGIGIGPIIIGRVGIIHGGGLEDITVLGIMDLHLLEVGASF